MEELLKQISEGQKQLFNEVKAIRSEMATKEDIARLERLAIGSMEIVEQTYKEIEKYGQAQQEDVKGLLEIMDRKLDRVITTQVTQGESINILAMRQLQIEAEVVALKKAQQG